MSILTKSDYDLINLGQCIKAQADRAGIEHEGVPLEGVVVRLAEAAISAQKPIEVTDAMVEKAARELNRVGWTCMGGSHEPGGYDACQPCRDVCLMQARVVLDAALGKNA